MKVEFYKHNVNETDIENVVKVLHEPFLTTGKWVQEFEESLAKRLGCKHVVGVTSCTAALHLSLIALGLEGAEIITTPMTFVATANAIMYAEGTPVFVDVEKNTGNINLDLAIKHLEKKGRVEAIMPVYLYGEPCKAHKLRRFKNSVKIIVDAAHALETDIDFDMVDTACYSFYPTKSVTAGEGGAIATNDRQLAEKLKVLRLHGMTKAAWGRYEKQYQHWDMDDIGWKYNMTNIQAALLLDQLNRAGQNIVRRKQICEMYENGLKGVQGIELHQASPESARLMFTILVEKRDKMLHILQDKGIGVAVNFRPIHLLKFYQDTFFFTKGDFPVAEYIGDRTISLPLYPKLTDDEVSYVIQSVKEALIQSS